MDTINTLRVILVAGAVLAGVIAAVFGQWLVVGIMFAGVAGHAALWVYLARRTSTPAVRAHGAAPPSSPTV